MTKTGYEGSLKDKTVILGVCASISIYRTLDVIRDLRREGANVIVGMTEEAQEMIDPRLFEWASGNTVVTEITGNVEHVELFLHKENERTLLVCPATYNAVGKMANGIADDVVSLFFSFALGNNNPIVVCPVMHEAMMSNKINSNNLSSLESAGAIIMPPLLEDEKAKISQSGKIIDFVKLSFFRTLLNGARTLIIGGRGDEPIDPVRVITNRGTGLTGSYLSRYAFIFGSSRVVYVGNSDYEMPDYVDFHEAHTLHDYFDSVKKILESERFDIVINSASLPDFSVSKPSKVKLGSNSDWKIELKKEQKLNQLIREKHKGKFVTFKLEGSEIPRNANKLLKGQAGDCIVYNSYSEKHDPYGQVQNHYFLIDAKGLNDIGNITKEEMVRKLFIYIKQNTHGEKD
jgi:phosphopantothenoylcysteine decarboxylase/phosphopantothenate--cysteine ligase